METVLVVGAGFMGTGIAQVCAQSGRRVDLMDVKPGALDQALKTIKNSVEKLAAKGLVKEPPPAVLERISPVHDLSAAAQADWIIEAAFEIEDLKLQLFAELDRQARPQAVLASNTSTIPISRLARAVQDPKRVLGLHFFGPVPLMAGVEVVKGEKTSEEVFERGVAFVQSLEKIPIKVKHDIPGFVMNRIFAGALREAVDLVAKGVVSPEDVDLGLKISYAWNVGPFEIADNAGLDVFAFVFQALKDLGEDHLLPESDLLQKMVQAGRLGRKTGQGFYRYGPDGKRLDQRRE